METEDSAPQLAMPFSQVPHTPTPGQMSYVLRLGIHKHLHVCPC